MSKAKSVEAWLKAEQYLYNVTPILFIIGVFLLFMMVFLLLYVKNRDFKWKWQFVIGSLAIMAAMVLYLNIGNTKYGWYRQESLNVTTAIRDRQKKIFGYHLKGFTPPKVYDKAKIEATGLYTRHAIQESDGLTYIGETEYLYYFKVYKKLYNVSKNADFIEFVEGIEKPQFIGFNYTLNNLELVEIGFRTEVGPLYTNLQLPKSMVDQLYEHRGGKTEVYDY
ncbi:hypothetical protein [Vagococcus xieshaowenii]|uniref:Uncharacterized protein n=1 Tax=Vagococcus xieshaowenii TaxID=2562451 RepID=A0AAJ5EH42_9ENTE|nr:hypothetical protein [Vagococcus xieshaowenii]QCA28491.1 hypothetical protein E4Z98_03865 [Vagococcus xieshaowenii]TFZ42754.1 hypothetical protein E4031_01875 [Vagococcus xieshaowenii]